MYKENVYFVYVIQTWNEENIERSSKNNNNIRKSLFKIMMIMFNVWMWMATSCLVLVVVVVSLVRGVVVDPNDVCVCMRVCV